MLSFYMSILETEEEKKKMSDIYEEYRYYCIYIAKKYFPTHDDAEDASHATFLEIIKNKEKYFAMECSDLRASLVVIVRNKAFDILRRRSKVNVGAENPLGEEVADDAPSVHEIAFCQEEYERLRQALKELAPNYNMILTLKYFEGLSNDELAERLEISKKNVEVTLYRAKISLRKALEKTGGSSYESAKL